MRNSISYMSAVAAGKYSKSSLWEGELGTTRLYLCGIPVELLHARLRKPGVIDLYVSLDGSAITPVIEGRTNIPEVRRHA